MSNRRTYHFHLKKGLIILCLFFSFSAVSQNNPFDLPFPIVNPLNPFQIDNQRFDLGDPSGLNQSITYDPLTGTYIFSESLGSGLYYRNPSTMTLEEYLEYKREKSMSQDWVELVEEETGAGKFFEPARKLFKKCNFEPCEPFAHYKEDINSIYLTKLINNNP